MPHIAVSHIDVALEGRAGAGADLQDWQFTSRQACVKLQELYPVVHAHPD